MAGHSDVRLMDAPQSVLYPAGSDAEAIATLGWVMFGTATAIFLGVLAIAIGGYLGGESIRRRLASRSFIVIAGAVFPAVVLAALLVYALTLTGARISPIEPNVLRIEIIGEQWWWRVRYPAAGEAREVVTANEIRVPTGRPVDIKLSSADVIHSFWVPNIAGKVDMIPGLTNRIRLRPTAAGTYRGQCAEYCGGPHALMAFHVVVLEPTQFADWLAAQGRPAAPAAAPHKRGEKLFLANGCGGCHRIRGTPASGTIGPDLTHVGGRFAIAAGTLPARAESFARWIRDNQHIKPSNRMPPFAILPDGDLAAIAAYLENLK